MSSERKHEHGQSLVEFALVLPVLVIVLMGLFDFGRAVYAFNTVSNAAREGARVAIINQGPDTDGVLLAAKEAAYQATALGLDATDPSQIDVRFPDPNNVCGSHGVGCPVQVEVSYQFTPITPIIGSIVGPLGVSATTEMTIERTFPTP